MAREPNKCAECEKRKHSCGEACQFRVVKDGREPKISFHPIPQKKVDHWWELDTNIRTDVSIEETFLSVERCNDFTASIVLDDALFVEIENLFAQQNRFVALEAVAASVRNYYWINQDRDIEPALARKYLQSAKAGMSQILSLPDECLEAIDQHLRWGEQRIIGADHISLKEFLNALSSSMDGALGDFSASRTGAREKSADTQLISELASICSKYRDGKAMPKVSASSSRSAFVSFVSKVYRSMGQQLPPETVKSRCKKALGEYVKNSRLNN